MSLSITVPPGYGYTVLIALGVFPFLSFAQGAVVSSLRKPAKIPYPNAYATPQQMKESKEAYKFNCAQRAHANLLENLPQIMAQVLFSGLFFPRATPILGAVWALGRAVYAYGYITSDKPNGAGRYMGSFSYIGLLGLLYTSISGALSLL